MTDHEEGNMVSWEAREIAKNSVELRWLSEAYSDFLFKLSRQRRFDCLIPFDATAREEPAGSIAVAHEQNAVIAIDDDPLRAECKPSPHPR